MLRRVQYVPERTTKLIFASSQEAMVLSVGREPCVPITDSQILSAAASQPITQESDEEELQQSPRSPSSPIPRRRKALVSRKKRQRDADPVTDRPTKRQQPSRRGGISSTGPTTQSADLDQESDDECDKGKANVRCIPKKIKKTSDTPYFVESEEEHERDDDAFGDDVGLSEGDRDAGAAGVDVGGAGIDLPRLRQMLEPKLRSLHPSVQAEVQAELQKYDDDISRETAKIAAAHRAIKKKQIELVDKIGKLLEQHSQPPLSPEPSNPHSGREESDESCTGGHTDQVQHDTRKDDNTLVHTEEVVQGDQVLNDTPLEADKIDDNCRVVSLDTSTMNPIAHLSDNVTLELETFERGVVPRKKRSEKDSEKDQGDERFVNNLFNFDDAALSNIIHFEKDGYETELDTCTSKAGPNIISSNLGRTMDDNIGSLDLPAVQKIPYSRRNQKRSKDVDPNLLVDSGVKRTTRAPQKLSSPIKIGYMRTSPGAEVCANVENYGSQHNPDVVFSEESLDTAFDLYMTNDIALVFLLHPPPLLLPHDINPEIVPRVGMVFSSEEQAKLFYKRYAREAGFPMKLSRTKKSVREICCSRIGKGEYYLGNKEKRQRNNTSKKSGCKAYIKLHRDRDETGAISQIRTLQLQMSFVLFIPGQNIDYAGMTCVSVGSDGTTHSLRTTELLTEAMGVVRAAAMSSVGRDRAMDVLRELRKQLEALPPDLGPQAAPRPNRKRGRPAGSGAMKFTRSNSRITRSTVVTKTQDDAEGHDVSGQEDSFYSSDE
ncbi:hypothetical protein PR202_gb28616 [Eleusine coracana subsp. coracana]|uniref:FAR1 domain-containing protein n=1 Tax=Eleusine coracana subsp. coracana TaxID=191504 RepID=A0AAV5FUX5_ELECO|nr:hypothetical protein PR202_gb28616 [Eleusine coracana subsp. coracana]